MSVNEGLLPLFPLQVVLFPGSVLPLHIFEERYKVLINKCVREGSEFGINLIGENKVEEVGCSAKVLDVLRRLDDGRMDIVVQGQRRYRIEGYDTTRQSYLVGLVRYLENSTEYVDAALLHNTIELHNNLIEIVYRSAAHQISLDEVKENISFFLAQKSGLRLAQRQQLLELSSENERLIMLHRYLTDVIPKLREAEEIDRVIHSDGYL